MTDHTHARIDEQPPQPADDQRAKGIGAAMWVGSAVTHASALALMGLIYWSVADETRIELPPATSRVMPELAKPKPTETVPVCDNQNVVLPEVSDVVEPVTTIDAPPAEDQGDIEAPADLPPMVKGDASAVSDMNMGSTLFFAAIGANSGAPGKIGGVYDRRGKRGLRGRSGAPRICELGVSNALRWFKRHQSPNGMWDADGYFLNCSQDGAKCEPGKNQSGDTDVATTSYAVLCFLGDGYDQATPSTYRNVVRKGVQWLIANQKPDGLLGARNYEHAIATMALAQAYGMAPEPWLREPTKKAVDVILARQNRDAAAQAPYDRLGWDYTTPNGRNDASVTGWNVMALKAAMIAGLDVGEGISGSKAWLERSWKAANTDKPWCASTSKLDPYKGISRFGYAWKAGSNEVEISGWNAAGQRPQSIASQDLAPVGLMCAAFLGHQAGDPMLESLANYVSLFHQPTAWPCNTYYLYYNTLGMFQVGGERWERWAKQVLPLLHNAQRRDEGCLEGSWDWQGTQFHGSDTGRLLSTSYACLSMQVYWIYEKTQGKK
jgi:hypothetical protein